MQRPRAHDSLIALAALVFAGCGGSAKVSFISLHTQAIDPPRVEPFDLDVQECFWWLDADGDLCLAMRSHQGNIFLGQVADMDVELSFVLGKPPAGSGRDYTLGPRGVRTIVRSALQNQRYNTLSGIICVLTKPPDELHGSFRIWMTPMNELGLLSFLPGKPGPVMCYGRFRAIKSAARGQEILARTESGAPRPAKVATPPAATPPSAPSLPAAPPASPSAPAMQPMAPQRPAQPAPTQSPGVMQMVPSGRR